MNAILWLISDIVGPPGSCLRRFVSVAPWALLLCLWWQS